MFLSSSNTPTPIPSTTLTPIPSATPTSILSDLLTTILPATPSASPENRVFIRETSARELEEHLKSLPPLQREIVFDSSCRGRWVCWEGEVILIRSVRTFGYSFTVTFSSEQSSTVVRLSSEWRNILETIREGNVLKYRGKFAPSFMLTFSEKVRSNWPA